MGGSEALDSGRDDSGALLAARGLAVSLPLGCSRFVFLTVPSNTCIFQMPRLYFDTI